MIEPLDERILLFTPFGRDAELAGKALEHAGFSCAICKTFAELLAELQRGAAAVLSTEEALPAYASAALTHYLEHQATWSDLPILVLTRHGAESIWIRGAYERLYNLTLLERPVRSSTLISTARAALRARLRQYEVRSAERRKNEFLAMLAHELRNPLAPISAAADMLTLTASDAERVKQAGAIISRQVRHLTDLVDELLDVARVTHGLIAYKNEALDFRHILDEAMEQISPHMAARQQRLVMQLSEGEAPVLGDRKRLIQVAANLLGNAANFSPDDSEIHVRVEVDEHAVSFEVQDSGIGMTGETVARVFDLFAQAERTPDRSQGGLGLGLALVKHLVVAHGGSVHASSPGLGQGSTFTVVLPRLFIAPSGGSKAATAHSRADAAPFPLRILLVDDNADAADMLGMFLRLCGHEVWIAYLAADAIESARRNAPHVCLLDIGLPDMDGHELARRLRAMPQTAGCMLIALTGYSQESDRQKSLAAGFHHHFVKPVDTARLAQLLRRVRSS